MYCSISLGRLCVGSLWYTVKGLKQAEGKKEYVRTSRVGNKAFFAHCGSNSHCCFLVVGEYGSGQCNIYIVVPEGTGGNG